MGSVILKRSDTSFPFELHGKCVNEDCVQTMKNIPDNYIDLVVTSPPYDNQRTYKGFSWDFEETARQLFRIMKDGGVVVWVVGDQSVEGSETGTSAMQQLFFMRIGFNLHDTMIFGKNSYHFPQDHARRFCQVWEYMFVFSKNGLPKTFNPIREKTLNPVIQGRIIRNRQKDGSYKEEIMRSSGTFTIGNVWWYDVGFNRMSDDGRVHEHPAIFPEQLAADHIYVWSNPNDIVLDPFMGSGTTAIVSERMGRQWIGSEISEEYCQIIESRMIDERNQGNLFKKEEIRVEPPKVEIPEQTNLLGGLTDGNTNQDVVGEEKTVIGEVVQEEVCREVEEQKAPSLDLLSS